MPVYHSFLQFRDNVHSFLQSGIRGQLGDTLSNFNSSSLTFTKSGGSGRSDHYLNFYFLSVEVLFGLVPPGNSFSLALQGPKTSPWCVSSRTSEMEGHGVSGV